MEVKKYTVDRAGRVQGIWREKGETIVLDPIAARYPVMSGQIRLKGTKKTVAPQKAASKQSEDK